MYTPLSQFRGVLKPLYVAFFGLNSKMMKTGVTGHLPEKAICFQILLLLKGSPMVNHVTQAPFSFYFPQKYFSTGVKAY
jgi:hypothetical protein